MKIKHYLSIALIIVSTIALYPAKSADSKQTIIILQGCSSSGKSSVARALQNLYATENKPFMYLPMDDFLSFLPKKWLNFDPHDKQPDQVAEDGIQFITIEDQTNAQPIIKVIVGQTVINAFIGMVQSINALAHCKNNVIFEGAFPKELFEDIEELRKEHVVYIINIQCDLAIMEEREIKRNGRIGLTKSQYQDSNYRYEKYDFSINTSNISPDAAAQQIKDFIVAKANQAA